jgi:plasmid replication initiation protein
MDDAGVFMALGDERKLSIIKKDNDLIQAKYRVGIHEQRLLYAVLGAIRVDDKVFNKYTIDLKEIAQLHGLTSNNDLYKQLHRAAEELLVTVVDISIGKTVRKTTWLNYVEYVPNEAQLKVTIHDELKPYLLQLKANFTQYNLAAVANFKNSYSIRFYELLKMRQNMGKGGQFYIEYALAELKKLLGIPNDEYQKNDDFRKRIIKPAIEEINAQTDLNIVQVDYLKKGRAIHSIKIIAEPKKQRILAIQDPEDTSRDSTPKPPPEKLPQAVQALLDFGFSESEARALVKMYKSEKALQSLAYVNEKRKERELKDPCAYLRTVLKGDAGEKWANTQKQAQENSQQQIFEQQKQEAEDLKKAKREQQELEKIIALFEQLDDDEQEIILDEIELGLKGLVQARFKAERGAFSTGNKTIYRLHTEAFRTVLTAHGYL